MTSRRTAFLVAAVVVVGSLVAQASAWAADGYWLGAADGSVYPFGDAADHGSLTDIELNQPIVCIASTPSGGGYWQVARDGGVFNFGDAPFLGSTGDIKLNRPIVGMTPSTSGRGYWLVASDGGVFNFGDAAFLGSTGDIKLNRPIVGMGSSPSGEGYWLVASDGGVFTFGDATFFGSTGDIKLNRPIVGMTRSPSANGYWLAASDGGIFNFGDAPFLGSTGDIELNQPIVAVAATASGGGYWLVASDGGVFTFGDAVFVGSAAGTTSAVIVGMTPVGHPGSCGQTAPTVLAQRIAAASAYARTRQGTTGVAVVDITTSEALGSPSSGVAMRAASIVKIIVAMALYARAEREGRGLTAAEQSDLSSMIRVSDNDATSRLWDSLGQDEVISWVRRATGVRATEAPEEGHGWGFTTTTAHDMAAILANLARAKSISAAHRDALLNEMRNVIPSQRWGIAPAVHRSTPAVKNGWYPDDDSPLWRVHCAAVVDDGSALRRWVVVVMTRYPSGLGMGYGEDTCQQVAVRALPAGI